MSSSSERSADKGGIDDGVINSRLIARDCMTGMADRPIGGRKSLRPPSVRDCHARRDDLKTKGARQS